MEVLCASNNRTLKTWLENECHTDWINIFTSLFCMYVAILMIAYLRWTQDWGKNFSNSLKFYGHNLRNSALIFLLLVHILGLSDAVLSNTLASTFIVPTSSLGFWASAVILSHVLEASARPGLLPVTAILWALNCSARCLRVINLTGNSVRWDYIRPVAAVLEIGVYGLLALAELVAFKLETPKFDVPLSTTSRYKHDEAHFISKATFHWLTPLLRAGYSCPLEADDLGALPETHKSKTQQERFKKISKNQKFVENKPTLYFWKVCWAFMKTDFLFGGVLKFLGDILSLVPPIGLAAFVTYVGSLDAGKPKTQVYTTFEELWENGWVVAAIVFVASIAQSTCSQSSTHLVNIRAIHLSAALQAEIYGKTLRLTKMKSDDEFGDALTHLLTEDAVNIMSAFWVGHYLWAIPLKIALLMVLLYRYLGMAALIGSAVTILTLTPLQLLIGREMSKNTKILSDITDERLFLVGSMIESMKLLKMLGWEDVFCKKIQNVRERETTKLDRESVLWGSMTLLTHVSSILVTVITLGTYSLIEGTSLTAPTVFTALALFNQLTVPLFIFPVTIPIFISAIVSGRRIADYLYQCEMSEISPKSEKDLQNYVTSLQAFPEEFSCSASLADMDAVWLPLTPLQVPNEIFSFPEVLDGIEEDNEDEPIDEEIVVDWGLNIRDCVFRWPNSEQSLCINSVIVPYGKLTIIVGNTGSGKSSLLSGILGEMELIKGQVVWQKGVSVAYAGQTAWLTNGTVRDNILFGRPFKPRRYGQVIHACALQPDLDILPLKDLTEVGERGIHLSGGQKQRIGIARALYSRSNFVILDDPLSSLDNAVASQVFEAGIKRLTRRGKRTVLLVTHQLNLLPSSDKVIVMENNSIRIQGQLNEIETLDTNLVSSWRETAGCDMNAQGKTARERWQLVKHVASVGRELKQKFNDPEENFFRRKSTRRRKPALSDWNYLSNDLPSAIEECGISRPACRSYEKTNFLTRANSLQTRNTRTMPVKRQHSSPLFLSHRRSTRKNLLRNFVHEPPEQIQPHRKVQRLSSTESGFSDAKSDIDPDEYDELEVGGGGSAEEREYGHVPRKILVLYGSSAGIGLVFGYFVISLIWQVVRVATDGWLSKWTENSSTEDVSYYLWVYNSLSLMTFLLSLASHAAGQWAGSKARVNLHNRLLTHMSQCTISSIQTTSSGRFLNRFSTDINVIDKKLPTSVQRLLQFVLLCGSALFVNAIITPWFLLAGLPICLLYYSIQKFYRTSSRELQRLESLSRSPVLSHLLETQSGLTTIRAYGYQNRFISAFFSKLDQHTNAFLILNSANRWLGIVLDYMGSVIVAVAMITALITSHVAPGQITASLAGLAINYTLLVPIYLNWVVKFLSESEMYMAAVERINQIFQLPVEEDVSATNTTFPLTAQIRFENVTLRYSPTTEPIFTGLDLFIPHGEKVGICGRSGSGKSTLALALFRLLTTTNGKILVNSTNLELIPLQVLRDRVAVVPQDAVLLPGTVRENLDPRENEPDASLWSALDAVRLADFFKNGLDADLASIGLSYGQRQLFCLARAILRQAPLLILDEASSNLDKETESVLMAAAFRAFAGKTVIVIAHRLSTLLDCDRILVIDRGRIVEDGAPSQLLTKQMGLFSTMLRSEDSF